MSDNPFASPFGNGTEESETTETTVEQVQDPVENMTNESVDVESSDNEEDDDNNTDENGTKLNKDGTPRKPRGKSNRRKTPEETKFILENYKDMSTKDIADRLGLTRQQVYRTVLDAKKAYLEKAETAPPEKAEKIKAWVEEHLPSKTENRGGGKKGSMIDDVFEDIFGDI